MAFTSLDKNSRGSYHFSANRELYEIQRGNNFDIVISGLANMPLAGTDGATSIANGDDYVRLAVDSMSVPHYSQSVIDVRRGNTAIKYAGVMSWDSGSLVCKDFIGTRVKDILMGWQALSGDPWKQTVGMQSEYKKDATLIEYTPDYKTVVRTWKLDGCWISRISEDAYSQSADGERKVTCEIQYDRAYVDYE